jgi:hypothetical protein
MLVPISLTVVDLPGADLADVEGADCQRHDLQVLLTPLGGNQDFVDCGLGGQGASSKIAAPRAIWPSCGHRLALVHARPP